MSTWTPTSPSCATLHRALGDSEFAFFKNSSTGLGDMFLHLALRAPRDIMRRERVCIAWCAIRVTHPLLMSSVAIGEDVIAPALCFTPPADAQDALASADRTLHYRASTKHELISDYMNGPRTLSNDSLSYLVVSQMPSQGDSDEFDLFMCAPHFIGDGTSLHQSTHDLIVLLASQKSDAQLLHDLEAQLERKQSSWLSVLPPSLESRLRMPSSPLLLATHKIAFLLNQQHELGGHIFPRTQHAPRRTRLVEHAFTKAETQAILAVCKRNGASVNNALFALSAIAWTRMRMRDAAGADEFKLPTMIYSAINLRPHLSPPSPTPSSPSSLSYWFLPLTYFTVVLPSFLPASAAAFWHRARLARMQTARSVGSPFLASRAAFLATQRAGARHVPDTATHAPAPAAPPAQAQLPPHARPATASPSRALLGLSLIGNLDHTYTRSSYDCPGVSLHTVTTASRQKEGGLLVLGHTFAGQLWLHLCWDEEGFARGVVEGWWGLFIGGVAEYTR
ncbi:hypothetical protein JB92DRAFT_3040573 [Gautieria morchelliformis]|nr:hypothetical protein JB92DRAFT_3040573 [Gautieria morchelliformis]